jgi:putative nucleotidyltransferase with HDIG domain
MTTRKLLFYLSNQHNLIVKLMIFFISVGIMVYVLPREGKFRFEFVKGKVWLHDDFSAPFDFAINKSDKEIREETYLLERAGKKYYVHDAQVLFEKQRDLASELDTFIRRVTGVDAQVYAPARNDRALILASGRDWLSEIYSKGVLQSVMGANDPSTSGLIVEMHENIAEEKRISDYYTKDAAMKLIAEKLYASEQWKDPELKLFFERFITPNVFYSDQLTRSAREKAISNISLTRGMVSKGELIIAKGELVTPEKFQILESVREEYEAQVGSLQIDPFYVIGGQAIMVSVVLAMLLLFLILLRRDLFEDSIKLSFLFSLVVAEVVMVSIMAKMHVLSVYIFPFCIMPIIIRSFFDTRLAMFAHLLTMMIIGFIVPNPFEFFIIQMTGGIACIFSIVNMRKRSQLFITITLLTLAYLACYVGLTLMVEGQLDALRLRDIVWLMASAALSLFSYPIIYFIEKVFGFSSDVSLLELSDTNNPLLKQLALQAPGTFQHSLQVANLAEAAISRIGGNTLLTRTGALYHDIGKLELARYFIENQVTGVNPHDELDFDESARLIISHVKRGIQLARKHNLPEKIIDFIRTHHGNSRVQYFYRSFLRNFPDAEVDEAAFRYPGPIPFSRETAVVMMADAVEATSRSLKVINSETIDKLVEDIIRTQIEDNQYINANITFKDITAIKKIFKKMLMNIYHVRVEYPK